MNNAINIKIRSMKERDLPSVIRLEREAFGKMAWSFVDFESSIASSYDFPLIVCSGSSKEEDIVYGERTGKSPKTDICSVLGYAVLRILGPEAELENICVDPMIRRRGIGRKLLEEVINLAGFRGSEKIFLDVRSGNKAALGLYETIGFRMLYIRKNYYTFPSDDAIVMLKELKWQSFDI